MKPYSDVEITIIAGCDTSREAITELRRAGYHRTPKAVTVKFHRLRVIEQPRNAPRPMSLGSNVLWRMQ